MIELLVLDGEVCEGCRNFRTGADGSLLKPGCQADRWSKGQHHE